MLHVKPRNASSYRSRTPYPSRVREWRTRRGLTQRQLATLSGVARPAIWRVESGFTFPTAGTLVALAVDPPDLIGPSDPPR